jgi:hypothetical protein
MRLDPGRYAAYVDSALAEIPEGGPEPTPQPMQRSELVIIEVD